MMLETLKKIESAIENESEIVPSEVKEILNSFLKTDIKGLHIENYIGDYPTFMEPVYLGENVTIGEDVLIGPNVYIGDNSEIGNYVELTNVVIFNHVKLGQNFKLNNCIVAKNSNFQFDNLKEQNCILMGNTNSIENLRKMSF